MARETIRVEGLKGVLETLKQLPPEIVSKRGGPVRASLRKALKVMHAQALMNVQSIIDTPNKGGQDDVSLGLLKKSIVIGLARPLNGRRGEAYSLLVRRSRFYPPERIGKGKKVTAWKVGFLLENGTERRQAYPWMRPAFEAKKQEVLRVYVDEMNRRIAQIVRKLERKNKAAL